MTTSAQAEHMANTGDPTAGLEGSELFDSLVDSAIQTYTADLPQDPDLVVPDGDQDGGDTPVEDKKETAPETTGLERLTAREAEIARKEKEVDGLLAELKRVTAKPAEPNKNTLNLDEINKLKDTNLPAVLDKLGLDREFVMDVLIAEKLGDRAPKELQEKLRDYKLKKEIESLRSERDQERNLAAQREYYNKVFNESREYVTKSVDEKVAPTVSLAVKADPSLVHDMVIAELNRDAQAKVARGETNASLLTYAEAVGNVEKLFSKIAAAVKNVAPETTKKKGATGTTPPLTRTKPDKPRDEIAELEEAGILAAKRIYASEEAKRKR